MVHGWDRIDFTSDFKHVHDLDGFPQIPSCVEVDVIDQGLRAGNIHQFGAQHSNIILAYRFELVEVVTAVEVVSIDLVKPIHGVLHAHQDHHCESLIHQISDRSE